MRMDDARNQIKDAENEIEDIEKLLQNKKDRLSRLKTEFINEYGPIYLCRICGKPHEDQEFAENYKDLMICRDCEKRAVNTAGSSPWHDSGADNGDNPLFIDGVKCWRRYKFGGFITLIDEHDCNEVLEFYKKHFGL